jgi:hypothetical protein
MTPSLLIAFASDRNAGVGPEIKLLTRVISRGGRPRTLSQAVQVQPCSLQFACGDPFVVVPTTSPQSFTLRAISDVGHSEELQSQRVPRSTSHHFVLSGLGIVCAATDSHKPMFVRSRPRAMVVFLEMSIGSSELKHGKG